MTVPFFFFFVYHLQDLAKTEMRKQQDFYLKICLILLRVLVYHRPLFVHVLRYFSLKEKNFNCDKFPFKSIVCYALKAAHLSKQKGKKT